MIDPGLKFYADGEWVEPPHYYGGEKKYMPESLKKLAQIDWRYLCVHAEAWNARDSIFTYLEIASALFGKSQLRLECGSGLCLSGFQP